MLAEILSDIGINIKNSDGSFREFGNIMSDIVEKWDSLETHDQDFISILLLRNALE